MTLPFKPSNNLISLADARDAVANVLMCDSSAGRPLYQLLNDEQVIDWLAATKIDRYRWTEAIPKDSTQEFVCTTYSILLWPLAHQEALRCGLIYPPAFGRVVLWPRDGVNGHNMCGFLNERRQFRFVEPQNDRIMTMPEFLIAYPGLEPNRFDFE